MDKEALNDLLIYYNELKAERAPFESLWRSTAAYSLPFSQFNESGNPSLSLREGIYDGTAIHSRNMLASELLGMTINPNDRNFELAPVDDRLRHDDKMKRFVQYLGEGLQFLLHCPEYGFYTSAHEMLVEYVGFGQSPFLVEKKNSKPRYLACPVSQCYTALNDSRKVDSVIRSWRWTLRQLRSAFPPDVFSWPTELQDKLKEAYQEGYKIEVCHAMIPSIDHPRIARNSDFPGKWTHIIFTTAPLHAFEVKGLDVFPYAVPRYMMMAEEYCGRGPAGFALPEMRMVNTMERTNIQALMRQAAPPMILPRRGWIRPLNASPDAINYYDSLEDVNVKSFGIDGNPQLSIEFTDRHRDAIREIFHIDSLMGLNKRAEVKELEVLASQEKSMRALAPQLARLYTEWIDPTLHLLLHYFQDELLESYDQDLPEAVQGGDLALRVKYMSPLQRAQSMLDAAGIKRILDNFLFPIFQLDPTLMQRFDGHSFVDWTAESFNLPLRLLKPKEEAEQAVQQQQQQAQLQQGITTGVEASEIAKNLAQAQAVQPQQQGLI